MLDGIKVNGRLLNWDLHDWVCIIGTIAVCVALLHATFALGASIVICSEHGVKATPTGNTQTIKRKKYCEYSHPQKDLHGVHKFWSECD